MHPFDVAGMIPVLSIGEYNETAATQALGEVVVFGGRVDGQLVARSIAPIQQQARQQTPQRTPPATPRDGPARGQDKH